ncbi:MAG TPA: AI-2E family transporter [Acidimicrobiales bacterium]|nr:AI-2E family transporter [Acidimicrobiales bacterium]
MPSSPRGAAARNRLTVDLDPRSALALVGAGVALLAVISVLRSVPRTGTAVAVAVIISIALDPLVTSISARFRVRRAIAVAMLSGATVVVAVIAAVLVAPAAINQAQDLGAELPAVLADLENVPIVGDDIARAGIPGTIERWVKALPDRLSGDATPISRAAGSAANGILAATLIGLLVTTILIDGPRLVGAAERVIPARHRRRTGRAGRVVREVVGRYVAGSLAVAGVAGCYVLIVGLVLGVPLAPLLAAWVALWDLVPQVGGAAGGIPFVLLGFAAGPGIGLACAVLFVLYLQIENNVIQPLLVGQAIKLSPPATMAAALIGVSAGGVIGALVAVPLTGAVKAIYLELRPPAGNLQ